MLAITQDAANAIDGLIDSTETGEEAGMRITTEIGASGDGVPRTELRLALVEHPEDEDQVIADVPVFLAPDVAPLLDDKVLDADISGEQIKFTLAEQA